MAKYTYGYLIYQHKNRARHGQQALKYADLFFNLVIVNEKAYPLHRGDTVAQFKWVADKTKAHEGWIGPHLVIEPRTHGAELESAKIGIRLVDRIISQWGFSPRRELGDEFSYWHYVNSIAAKDQRTSVLAEYDKLRESYEIGRMNWLDPWALALYGFPAMKIHRHIRDQRISEVVRVDRIKEPGSDKWLDNWRAYDPICSALGEGAAVGCLAPNEQIAKARLEEKFFSKDSDYGWQSKSWNARRQAWLDADRPVISMTNFASWSYELPIDRGLDHELAVPNM
jgi:hypothetical protein